MTNELFCPCDFCNGTKYTVDEYLQHIEEILN